MRLCAYPKSMLLSLSLIMACAPMRNHVDTDLKDDLTAEQQTEILKDTAAKNNEFAFALYQSLNSANDNVLISPYSISSVLAMTYDGAQGTTAEEMAKALHFNKEKVKTHQGFKLLNKRLTANDNSKEAFELSLANRLYGDKDLQFKDEFLATTKDYYDSQLETLDFKNHTEAARQQINKWVEGQTHERIKDLLGPGSISHDTTLVLANALYLKARWVKAFANSDTVKDQIFITEAGIESADKVEMMHQGNSFLYAESQDLDAKAAEFNLLAPAGSNLQLAMLIILPNNAKKFAGTEKSINARALDKLTGSLAPKRLDVTLPKFQVNDWFENLQSSLEKLGMPTAFRETEGVAKDGKKIPAADFKAMADVTPQNIYLNKVVHKTFLEANEVGIEAAGATAAIMVRTMSTALPEAILPFKADHAFMYVLRDRATGTILFMGKFVDPAKKS